MAECTKCIKKDASELLCPDCTSRWLESAECKDERFPYETRLKVWKARMRRDSMVKR